MFVLFGILFLVSLTLAIVTAIYLFSVETDVICVVDGEDGAYNYKVILTILFTVFVVDTVRSIIMVIAIATMNMVFALIYSVCALNECLGFCALIILHVYRFNPTGAACAKVELPKRGAFLLGLVIYIWVSCVCNVCVNILKKKKGGD